MATKNGKTVSQQKSKKAEFRALKTVKVGGNEYGLYAFNGRVYTGIKRPDTRAFKAAIPLAIAKKLGLVN